MKLFILGHTYTLNAVRRHLLKNHSEIEFETAEADLTEPEKMSNQIRQAESEFDGILFTGRTPYDILQSRIMPQKPWVYIRRRESQILSVLLKASAVKHYDIRKLSVDSPSLKIFERNIVEQTFHSIAIPPSLLHINHIDVSPTDGRFVQMLVNEHEKACRNGKAAFCITSISQVCEELSAKRVPAFRIEFDERSIENAIAHLNLLHVQRTQNRMEIRMVMIELCDRAEGCGLYGQRASLCNQFEMMEEITELGNSLNGALIEISNSCFCLIFYQQISPLQEDDPLCYQHIPRLISCAKQKSLRIHIGIGIHPNPRPCHQYALQALAQARSSHDSAAFLCDKNGQCYGPLYPASQSDQACAPVFYSDDLVWNLSKKTGIHMSAIEKILRMKSCRNGEFSSHDLADALGISARNANRLITLLEEHHVIEIAGKRLYPEGGRPLRIFRLTL